MSLQMPTTWWCYRKANNMIATLLAGSWVRKFFTTKKLKVKYFLEMMAQKSCVELFTS